MFEAVMPTASTMTQQASGTVSSVAPVQPYTSTPVVGNLPLAPTATATLANSAASQNTNVIGKDQSSSHSRDRDHNRNRSRSRERPRRERSRSRDRHRNRDKSRDHSRDRRRGRDRSRERGRDRSRSRGRDRDRSRSRDRDRSHDRDRSRGRYRDRSRSRDRDRKRSGDRSRSHDRDKRDEGKRKSRWDTGASRDDTKQSTASQMPAASNPQQLSTTAAVGTAAAAVQNLLNSGRMSSAEQPGINPLVSSGVNNPSMNNVPSMQGRLNPTCSSTVHGGHGPGLQMAPGIANPPDANKMASQNVSQNMQRFPGNASNVATNNVRGDLWKNTGTGFGASNVPNNNLTFSNTAGMPQGPRFGGQDAGGPYQMGNANNNMGRFRGPSMMNDTSGNNSSGGINNNMNDFMRPQGTRPPPPAPGNVDSMQGFRNQGGTVGSDFSGMERSGPGMSGHVNNMPQSSGSGMRMPGSAEGPRGFGPRFPGADNMNNMQGQGARMMFGNNSRMPTSNDRTEVDTPRHMLGDSTGPFQRPPYDGGMRFGNMTRMQDSDMQSGGSGSGNFTNMTAGNMSGMMNNRPESGMNRERMPNFGKHGSVQPLMDDTFFNQSASPRPPSQVPPPNLPQSGKQGNTNPVPPPPPPPLQDNKNLSSSLTSQTFGPVPVGVPAPPPSQGSVANQQTAEQMQAAMAYYYAQWMQQQQQPPPPPPPPPK